MVQEMDNEEQEIIRLVRRPNHNGESLDLHAQNPYKAVPLWRDAFVLMARGVAKLFSSPKTAQKEIDARAGLLLKQSSMILNNDPFAAQHPGELEIPGVVFDNCDATEILSVWSVPRDPEDIEEDGVEEKFHLLGDTESLEVVKLGNLLAQIAQRHIFFASKGDRNTQFRMQALVQKDFNARFDIGMTRQ